MNLFSFRNILNMQYNFPNLSVNKFNYNIKSNLRLLCKVAPSNKGKSVTKYR